MPCVQVKHFSFQYPGEKTFAVHDVSFSAEQGEMVLVFGSSGSGKTTLLSNLKKEIAPNGVSFGEIVICEKNIANTSDMPEVGFVFQSPENQIVTDTVEHELAFGMENAGMPAQLIRRRIAEIACYFGLEPILHHKTSELSGGQKQLLNLAAVLCLEPSVLILDEPLSRLDPIAAEKFLHELRRVNAELGITVILSEHVTENILPFCTKVIFLESGSVAYDGNCSDFVTYIAEYKPDFTAAMPTSAVLAYKAGLREHLPLTVNDGKNCEVFRRKKIILSERQKISNGKVVMLAEEIRFAYARGDAPVLCGADIKIRAGEVHAVVGGNGEGKSTLLNILAGCRKPVKGKVKKEPDIRTALLPQEPKLLFYQDELLKDLTEFCRSEEKVRLLLAHFGLSAYEKRHPYDLSGGEIQKAALAKLLLTEPDVLLLDEPVKGLDIRAKEEFSSLIKDYVKDGHAVVLITHDLDFAADTADRITMISCGKTVCCEETDDFFKNNRFFTTAGVRLTRKMPVCVLTPREVIGFE